MSDFFFSLCLVYFIVIFRFVTCENLGEKEEHIPKVIVHPRPNTVTNFDIKPTSATADQESGIPPDRSKPPQITATKKLSNKPDTKHNKPFNLYGLSVSRLAARFLEGTKVTENIVESKPLMIRDPYANRTQQQFLAAMKPQRGNVIDWFLGIVGIRPPDPSPPPFVPPAKNCPKCTCGQTYKRRRIVGGIETMVNEYVWMTALMYNNRFLCGASLINNKYILTAAHCVSGFSKDKFSAVFLDHDRSTPYETQTIMRRISTIYKHNFYGSGGSYNNDIALMQLDQEIPLTGMTKPVCLPPTGRSFTSNKGIAVGWGATKEHGQVSNKLLEVTVPILSNMECRKTGYGYKITENMLCAGYPDGQKDSCQGDSGGPLHVINGTIHQIVGIVSWGEGCAQPNFPGVYTRVNRYVSWIKSNTRDACYC